MLETSSLPKFTGQCPAVLSHWTLRKISGATDSDVCVHTFSPSGKNLCLKVVLESISIRTRTQQNDLSFRFTLTCPKSNFGQSLRLLTFFFYKSSAVLLLWWRLESSNDFSRYVEQKRNRGPLLQWFLQLLRLEDVPTLFWHLFKTRALCGCARACQTLRGEFSNGFFTSSGLTQHRDGLKLQGCLYM